MKSHSNSASLFLRVFFVLALAFSAVAAPVKYVFLFIGDGMAAPQRTMAADFAKRVHDYELLINELPYAVATTTHAANSLITDSAASGTAFACGAKTNNGYIGVTPDGKPVESVAYVAQKAGKKVGIITSVTINHATPAAFYAHNLSRNNYYEIGLDMVASGFDFFGGGAVGKHNDTKSKRYAGSIYDLAAKAGYTVIVGDQDKIRALQPGGGKVFAAAQHSTMPYAIDAKKDDLTLADITEKAIELLDNPKGFFMMVEGGKIDWMCHANDAASVIGEMISFDQAVRVAYSFAQKHPDDTLIVVTGDHETGGLTLGFAGAGYQQHLELLGKQAGTIDSFRSLLKDLLAQKWQSLAEVYTLIDAFFSMKVDGPADDPLTLTAIEKEKIDKSYAREIVQLNGERKLAACKDAYEAKKKTTPEAEHAALTKAYKAEEAAIQAALAAELKAMPGSALAIQVLHIFNQKCGVAWNSFNHTALPVTTTAVGKRADEILAATDNTKIAEVLKAMLQ
ncbi:MAG: alkaline phosphatase [Lentisphaerae bacterium]|nr:alkaline phosphatase [Lentisphaerota bacterium]